MEISPSSSTTRSRFRYVCVERGGGGSKRIVSQAYGNLAGEIPFDTLKYFFCLCAKGFYHDPGLHFKTRSLLMLNWLLRGLTGGGAIHEDSAA